MMSQLRLRLVVRVLAAVGGVWLSAGAARADLQPDQLVLIVNRSEPAGVELANFYAQARGVPTGRILPLDLPKGEEISFSDYESIVVPTVRDWLVGHGLAEQAKCLVTFYGVPLRIAQRVNTPAEAAEQADLQQRHARIQAEIAEPVGRLNELAKQLNPRFAPARAFTLTQWLQQAGEATKEIQDRAMMIPDRRQRYATLAKMYLLLEPLMGDEATLRRMSILQALGPQGNAAEPATGPATQAAGEQVPTAVEVTDFRANYQRQVLAAERLEQQRYDPAARQQLRDVVSSRFGLLNYVHLLETQLDYLNTADTGSAFDSELSLVRWVSYSHVRWRENPFYYGMRALPPRSFAPTYMVMRLDAPQPEMVRRMINDSIATEKHGLNGQVVLDSRGMHPSKVGAGQSALAEWDQHIRDLGELLRAHTSLKVLADDKPEVLPPNSAKDVALYCGWYSLRNYIPECQFNAGAVGYHIASFEMVSLHNPGETGWVAGLLSHGVAATLGPVGEPYVQAFPRPDDFFPLLLTGKLTLAEVYWETEPMTSWQMDCVGDPLYMPYRANPAMAVSDLPARLTGVFEPVEPAP